jgi:hypothetical protein
LRAGGVLSCVVQPFQKIPVMHALATAGSQPFLLAQAAVLALCVLIAVLSLKRFRVSAGVPALSVRPSA